jgi:hypothetical protein
LSQAGNSNIPIYLATLRPHALEYTGAVADGWLGSSFTPEHAAAHLDYLRRSGEGAGLSLADLEIEAGGTVAFGDGRDASYGSYFWSRMEAMGITEVITAPRSPWQNAYVERVIGSIRRECLDHIVIFNERHLRRVLSLVRRLLPTHPHASFARKGLPRFPRDHATQDRKGDRHPTSRRPASPLRTYRRLISSLIPAHQSLRGGPNPVV